MKATARDVLEQDTAGSFGAASQAVPSWEAAVAEDCIVRRKKESTSTDHRTCVDDLREANGFVLTNWIDFVLKTVAPGAPFSGLPRLLRFVYI